MFSGRALTLLLLFSAWCVPASAGQSFEHLAREIRALVTDEHLPSVVVTVAKDGRIVWEDAAGWADRERRIPASPDTPYSLASISKPFTATAVMKLVETGHLDLDRPANQYLDGAKISGKGAERTTMRRLLSHSGGLPPYFRIRSVADSTPFEQTIAKYAVLRHRPGGRYVYSNLGYGILDHIVGRVSGVGFEVFLRREILEPLGLTKAFVATTAPLTAAIRYEASRDELPFYDLDHRGASAVYASARDLARFGMFHLNQAAAGQQSVLERKSIREMQRVHMRIGPGEGYGLGWRIDEDDFGVRHVGHTGGMPGVTTVLSLYPAERVVVVVLANGRSDAIIPLARRVAGAVMPHYGWRIRQAR